MNRIVPILVFAVVCGCSNEPGVKEAQDPDQVTPSDVITMSDAVDDYIEVAGLEEVPAVRSLEQLHHSIVSERYILIFDNRRRWLAAYDKPCKKLYESDATPDIRYERNTVRARFDTFRGCKVDRIYRVSRGIADEIMNLGKAPGEK